jgi:hypothetical protein
VDTLVLTVLLVQGKWVIERVTSEPGTPYQLSCVLKYAVELAVNAKPSRFIDLMEPLIERIIAEDLPSSVDAIRKAAENVYSKVCTKISCTVFQGPLAACACRGVLLSMYELSEDACMYLRS